MDFGKRSIIVASLCCLSALWCATVCAGPPPVPAKIYGTLVVDGAQITQDMDDGYIITVTRQDGSAFIPSAEDTDGLNEASYYIITIPLYDAESQPDGAKPGDTGVIHVIKADRELFIITPTDGEITVGASGDIARIDITAEAGVTSSSTIPLTTTTTTAGGGGGGGGGSYSTTTTSAVVTTSTTVIPVTSTSTTTTIPQCQNDGDCDDGSFCNGKETCMDGSCVAGKGPCDEGQVCSEDTDECRVTVKLTASCLPVTMKRPLLIPQRCTWLLLNSVVENNFNENSVVAFSSPSGEADGLKVNPDRKPFALGNFIFLPVCIQKDAVAGKVMLAIISEAHLSNMTVEEKIEASFTLK